MPASKNIEATTTASGGPSWHISRSYARLAILPGLFLAVFFLWPLVRVVWRSFTDPGPGVGNYAQILVSSVQLTVLQNTIETAAIVSLLCLLIAYPIAYLLSEARGFKFQVMMALVIIPLWTSVVIRSYAWMVVFQRRGVLNEALMSLGVTNEAIRFLPGAFAVHVGMVHIMLPFMVLPLLANMKSIDRALLRAASVMGAHPIQAFVKVFLPLSLPGISAGTALVFMMSLGFYVTPALLGGPRHMMAAVMIEQQANQLLNWGLASALSTVLLIVTTAIYLVYIRVTGDAAGSAAGR